MSDRYQQLVNTPIGRIVSRQVGLPAPVKLERYGPGSPVIDGPVLFGAARGGRLAAAATSVLRALGAELRTSPQMQETFKALIFDASGISSSERLSEAWAFFHRAIRQVRASGRIIVLATDPRDCASSREATAQRATEGLVRSIGKEVKQGATAQLLYVAPGAEHELESTLRFFLSPKSAYVSGQAVRIRAAVGSVRQGFEWERPLAGKVALVTGAARGIGASIADVLARDGAYVVGLDLLASATDLRRVVGRIGGSALVLDITADDAPARIAEHLLGQRGGVDIVVHNAGITHDRTLGRMTEGLWDEVIRINLTSAELIDEELLHRDAIHENGRIVGVSSISGIGGNPGQTNYSTSKAGVIGMVESMAPEVAERAVTINAVAPGFIETQMTQAMPIAIREAGRRMNSLSQGGLPIDVAETIAWLASPASGGVNGNVVRVCGQSLLGA